MLKLKIRNTVAKSNSSGFVAIEMILILVVLAVAGGTGWYVWHSKQQTNKTYTATSQAAQSTLPKTTKKSTSTPATQKYLTITEWSVRMKLTDNLGDAYYQIKTNAPDSAYLSLKSLVAVAPDCAPDKISTGVLFRQTVTEHDTAVNDPSDGNTPGDIKIGSYYYGFLNAQAGCFDDSNTAAAKISDQTQPRTGFAAAEKTLEATPGY